MKNYKKIILGFIVVITILGLVAFYSPVQNISQPQPSSESEENYSASLGDLASSTAPDSAGQTSTSVESEKSSYKDLSGFSDLGQESESLNGMGTSSTSTIDDIFNELNK